ncbi:MAG: ribonuclease P protein component 1 [Methanoregulaceae archaeon]
MIVPQNVYRHELTGLDVLVIRSSNPIHCGIRGKIVGETKNMVQIATGAGVKTISKSHATFRFTLPSGTQVDVDGPVLLAAPEKRISLQVK